MRGRKPKPEAIKRLDGNPGKRKIKPTPAVPGSVVMPPQLDGQAAKKWAEIAPGLEAAGILTPADVEMLATYCEAWAEYQEALLGIEEDGLIYINARGEPRAHPWARLRDAAWSRCLRLAVEFGMTPSSRSRVSTDKPKEAEEDPFLAWMQGQVA